MQRPNIRNTSIQTLFQILVLQRGGFIFDDYLEVVESVTGLTSKLERIRVHGYQEGDTTRRTFAAPTRATRWRSSSTRRTATC